MERGSKAASSEVELIDNRNEVEKYHDNEKPENSSKGIVEPNSKQKLPASDQKNEMLESPSGKNGPKLAPLGASPGDPSLKEASQKQKAAEDAEVELHSPSARDYRPQLDHMNANLDTVGRGTSHEKVELVSSPGSADKNIMQPAYSGFEGSDSSLGVGDGTDAQQTASSPFSPLIMEATQSFPMALAEKIPLSASYGAQSFYSEPDVNSVQPNQLNGHIGSSLQAGLLLPRRLEAGKTLFADQFEHNNGNETFSDNQQALLYSNLFPQNSMGIGFPNGGSTEINQQAPTWVSNELYNPLASSGSQFNQFKPTNRSDQQCYNFLLPRSSTPLSFRPQYFSDLHNQVPMAPGAYNSQTFSSMFPESSVSLRNSMLPCHHQINQLDVSDLPYSQASMLSGFQDLSGINLFGGTQCANPMLQESLMGSGSHQLSAHQQATNPFSMMLYLPNPELHDSEQPENSFLRRLQNVQQQGLLNQTARPIATYPSSGNSLSSLVYDPLLQQETGGTSAPHQMETSLSSYKEQEISEGRGHSRSRFELGESSSFKRFRRESTVPPESSAEQLNRALSLQNEASSSNMGTLFHPRPIRNSVYDPIFEGIGLPIDPHLRLFANN